MIDLRLKNISKKIIKVIAIGTLLIVICIGFTIILNNIPNTSVIEAMSNQEVIKNAAQFITQENIIEGSKFIFK